MKEWQSPKILDLGIEGTEDCYSLHDGSTTFGLRKCKPENGSNSSDSSGTGDSSCSSDCPFRES